jgi:hypothetical protein
MIAAIPTGEWKERAQFAFYYAAPNANGNSAVPLTGWTKEQDQWDGSDSDAYGPLHRHAIAYFNAVMRKATAYQGDAQSPGRGVR